MTVNTNNLRLPMESPPVAPYHSSRLQKRIGSHSNKWLLYSSTVILLGFILLTDLGMTVRGEGSRQDSNDIGTRHVDKIPPRSSPGRGSFGHDHVSNEVHSTSLRFPGTSGGDHEDDEEDEGSYDDDESYYDPHDHFPDSEEIKDVEYINSHENKNLTPHLSHGKPQIAKCCPYGKAIGADGSCLQFRNLEARHNQKEWYPPRVFNHSHMIPTNISEWEIHTSSHFKCGPNETTEIVSDLNTFAITVDGVLFLMKHSRLVPPLEFCVDQQLGKGEGRVVKSCFSREELCGDNQGGCLRKCCPQGSYVDEHAQRCMRNHLSDTYNFTSPNWNVLHEKPNCEFGHSLLPIHGSFSVNVEDGSLVTSELTYPFSKYCVDHFVNVPAGEDLDYEHNGSEPIVKVLMCFNDTKPEDFDRQGLISVSEAFATILGIALVFSAASIAIAALVSWRLPELRSLHGKCQLSHLATLFCLFICLAIVQLGQQTIPSGLCKFFAVFIHTCALSSFLWLNLLCFNIYMTFRSLRPPLAARRDENRRLFFLCMYAWGIPASFVAFLFILDSQPGRLEPMPRPEYGALKCLMSSRDAEFAYLFGPVGVLLLINGLLFCLTAQELLCGLWRLDNSDSITFRRKSMGLVVAKLGIVMGMGWILDVLSWGFRIKFPFLFYAGDVFNALQGVFICIVLLWRKRVLEVLHLRKPSITKDETLTVRPFLPKNGVNNASSHLDNDTSLVIVQEP